MEPRIFRTRQQWRSWLARHHDREKVIWLAYYKKGSGKTSITYEEALQEALCYGWIDSIIARIDEEKYKQKYTPRNDRSIWSASNKARIKALTAQGLMAPPGLAKVKAAQENGSWRRLNDFDRIGRGRPVPEDLLKALDLAPPAREMFEKRSPSEKKLWSYWILSAKKPETRNRRITETVRRILAGQHPGIQ